MESILDVDGSYLFQKHKKSISAGIAVASLGIPETPLSGWETVAAGN